MSQQNSTLYHAWAWLYTEQQQQWGPSPDKYLHEENQNE